MAWADSVLGRVKLRDLKVLLAVGQSGSMSEAAKRIAVSHPVVSKTISELERTLGVRLLERNARGVEPTPYGQALIRCGVAVFDELRQGLQTLELLGNADAGTLSIGCPELMSAGLLPAIADQFSQRYPSVILHTVFADTASAQFERLRERKVDLLLGTVPSPFVEDDLTLEHLFDEQFVVVAGHQCPWARRRDLVLDELIEENWVLPPPDSVPGLRIARIFEATKLPVPAATMINLSIHLTIALVATGRFIGILPSSIPSFSPARSSLKILPVKLPLQRVSVGILTVKNRTINPRARSFIECARKIAASLAK